MQFCTKVAPLLLLLVSIYSMRAGAQGQRGYSTYSDTLRAIVVFAKFSDDESVGDPNLNYRDWPLDLKTAPEFSENLLATSSQPPYPENSLTAYYHQQSLGNFVLYGTVHPQIFVTSKPEASYHRPHGGYGFLTIEILDYLDRVGYDFREYDHNRDGQIDYLFVILRRDSVRDSKKITFTGISCLDARCGGGIVGGRPDSVRLYDGLTFDWNSSGSILFNRTSGNVSPYQYHLRLMAHELGHDIWKPFFNHIPANRSNDVPADSNRDPKASCIGYALMAGSGGAPDCRGDETISAFERDLLGWIHCRMPDDLSTETIYIRDLVSTSDCFKIPSGQPDEYLYVTNRQRISVFDSFRSSGPGAPYELGLLRTTGLLVMRSVDKRLDVLVADNSLDLSVWNAAYEGDLFDGARYKQLSPFTRPNINGFNFYRPNAHIDWFAIDNIRYDTADTSLMVFEYISDFRVNPTIRSSSWIGPIPDSVQTTGILTLKGGATLNIQSEHYAHSGNIIVESGAELIVQKGSRLIVENCGSITIRSGGKAKIDGSLMYSGYIVTMADSRLVASGDLILNNCMSQSP